MRQVSFWHVRRRPLWLLESRRTKRRSRQGDGQLEAQVDFSLSHNSRGIWCVCGWGRAKSGLLPSRLLFFPSPGWAQSHWMRWRRCSWKRWSPTLAIGSSISVTIIHHHGSSSCPRGVRDVVFCESFLDYVQRHPLLQRAILSRWNEIIGWKSTTFSVVKTLIIMIILTAHDQNNNKYFRNPAWLLRSYLPLLPPLHPCLLSLTRWQILSSSSLSLQYQINFHPHVFCWSPPAAQ